MMKAVRATFPVVAHAAVLFALVLLTGCDNNDDGNDPTPVLASLSLNPASVAGGGSVQGTATLSAPAGSGGAVVTLTSNNAAATVPGSITIPAGSTSGTFTVNTTQVAASTTVTITGAFGASRATTLTVTPPVIAATFTVTSGTGVANRCNLEAGGQRLDCTFTGTQTTGIVSTWEWRYQIGANLITVPASGTATLVRPSTNGCGLFLGQTGGGPTTTLQMIVTLVVRDAAGNSAEIVNSNVSVLPIAGACGF